MVCVLMHNFKKMEETIARMRIERKREEDNACCNKYCCYCISTTIGLSWGIGATTELMIKVTPLNIVSCVGASICCCVTVFILPYALIEETPVAPTTNNIIHR